MPIFTMTFTFPFPDRSGHWTLSDDDVLPGAQLNSGKPGGTVPPRADGMRLSFGSYAVNRRECFGYSDMSDDTAPTTVSVLWRGTVYAIDAIVPD